MKHLITVGIVVLFIGLALILLGILSSGKSKIAVGGFIGFIPFGFATDRRLLWIGVVLAVLMLIFYLIIFLYPR
ncbi:MAG TPA: DUF131 domain-containing protein [Candidatus Nanoarchaeia archaeon]|nr:DUF131 domain-containing protein [Candidatus Nanoarchaeia archaeon]